MTTFRSRSRAAWWMLLMLMALPGCLTPIKLAGYREALLSQGLAVDATPCRQTECLHRKSTCLQTLASTQATVEIANSKLQKLDSLWSLVRSAPLADAVKQALASCEVLQ